MKIGRCGIWVVLSLLAPTCFAGWLDLEIEDVLQSNAATAPDALGCVGDDQEDSEEEVSAGGDTSYDEACSDNVEAAQRSLDRYTVTFRDWNGEVLYEQAVAHGENAIAPADPTREGYTFVGWNTGYDCVTADTIVSPIYEINSYTVTFKDWDGDLIFAETYFYGDAVTVPSGPARESDGVNTYSFAAWDSEVSAICVADATYTATYTATRIACGYCGEKDHVIKRCAKKSVAGGAVGRWSIPSVGVNVACFDSTAQSVCDAKDSACYFTLGSQKVIGDHQNQGFGAIKECEVGAVAYMDAGDDARKYVCTGVIQGHNIETDMTDADGNSIADMNPGGITCYTCNDNWRNITIVFFVPANES